MIYGLIAYYCMQPQHTYTHTVYGIIVIIIDGDTCGSCVWCMWIVYRASPTLLSFQPKWFLFMFWLRILPNVCYIYRKWIFQPKSNFWVDRGKIKRVGLLRQNRKWSKENWNKVKWQKLVEVTTHHTRLTCVVMWVCFVFAAFICSQWKWRRRRKIDVQCLCSIS